MASLPAGIYISRLRIYERSWNIKERNRNNSYPATVKERKWENTRVYSTQKVDSGYRTAASIISRGPKASTREREREESCVSTSEVSPHKAYCQPSPGRAREYRVSRVGLSPLLLCFPRLFSLWYECYYIPYCARDEAREIFWWWWWWWRRCVLRTRWLQEIARRNVLLCDLLLHTHNKLCVFL